MEKTGNRKHKRKSSLEIGSGKEKVGGDEKKRAEERTQVSNHLPGEKKVQLWLFIKETRPALMKRIVCFPPHLIHSKRNVQSKGCGVVKTFHPPPPPPPTSTSSDSQLIPKHQETNCESIFHQPFTKNTIILRNVLK